MKRIIRGAVAAAVCAAVMLPAAPVAAKFGDMGFNGGITEGVRLPKTTEQLLTTTRRAAVVSSPYKEVVALGGYPVVIDGILNVRGNSLPTPPPKAAPAPVATTAPGQTPKPADPPKATAAPVGTYSVTQEVRPATAAQEDRVTRTINFNVNWRRDGQQLVEDWTMRTWTETVLVGGETFVIQPALSHYDVSALYHETAGVTYYKADISARAVYLNGEARVTVDTSGQMFGYESAWSATETHRLDVNVFTDEWQTRYQVRPSVSVDKSLQYSANEPTAISFEGNYREVMSNLSGLIYDVSVMPAAFWDRDNHGSASIKTYNTFEQLPAQDTAYLKGHAAEADIKKLFAMGVLTGNTKFYQPAQAITRGEFTTMLAKAVKLPIDTSYQSAKGAKAAIPIVFPDVQSGRADYPYIMAVYNAGIAIGRGNGMYQADSNIEREEAFALVLRSLGLTNLGLDPTPATTFADDAKISNWAKRDLYAAGRIDLIRADDMGNINPRGLLSKAEAAALINRLIDYMREGLQLDYTEHIVNYAS